MLQVNVIASNIHLTENVEDGVKVIYNEFYVLLERKSALYIFGPIGLTSQ